MNVHVAPLSLASRGSSEVIEHTDGSASLLVSQQLAGHYDRDEQALWIRWSPRGVPSFNPDLLHDLERASNMVEGHFLGFETRRPLRHIVLGSAIPGAFSVGGDLGYFQRLIVAQDRAQLTEYARAAVNVIYNNYVAHNLRGVTTVALLEGDALGGGLECALSCDVVVAERHIKAGFPEILFNLFPGMGGMSFLARRVSRAAAEEMVRTGRQYTALELRELGLVDEVAERGHGRATVLRLMRRREHQAEGHAAISAVDRLIRPVTRQELHEVVRLWVDCALQLSPRGLEWMQRLYQRQLAIFGASLSAVAIESSQHGIGGVAAAA